MNEAAVISVATARPERYITHKKIKGFASEAAILTAPETRSSSPVRIVRDEDCQSVSLNGLYPAGEGAGCLLEILRKVNAEKDGDFILTVEPHLNGWIPERFADQNAAFDGAVNALKGLLAQL